MACKKGTHPLYTYMYLVSLGACREMIDGHLSSEKERILYEFPNGGGMASNANCCATPICRKYQKAYHTLLHIDI